MFLASQLRSSLSRHNKGSPSSTSKCALLTFLMLQPNILDPMVSQWFRWFRHPRVPPVPKSLRYCISVWVSPSNMAAAFSGLRNKKSWFYENFAKNSSTTNKRIPCFIFSIDKQKDGWISYKGRRESKGATWLRRCKVVNTTPSPQEKPSKIRSTWLYDYTSFYAWDHTITVLSRIWQAAAR